MPIGTKSRETIYGASVRAAAERAAEARKQADRHPCEAWNKRMLAVNRPAQHRQRLGETLNAGPYLEVRCLGCDMHQAVTLEIVHRPKTTPIYELERYMRRKDCSQMRGHAYKRSHLVALRHTKISASNSASTWWPGERDSLMQIDPKMRTILTCRTISRTLRDQRGNDNAHQGWARRRVARN